MVREFFGAFLCVTMAGYFTWLVYDGWRTGRTSRNGIRLYSVTYVRRKQPIKFSLLLLLWATQAAFCYYFAVIAVSRALNSN
jgi:hypothetical protein